MAEEYEKYALMKNMFRRRSSTEFTPAGYSQVVDTKAVPSLLSEMGSKPNPNEVKKLIDQVDSGHTGRLTYEQYQKLGDNFVKDASKTSALFSLKGFSDFDT